MLSAKLGNICMFKHSILSIFVTSLICLSSHSVMAKDNQTMTQSSSENVKKNSSNKLPESYLSIEEIDKLMAIHFPEDWKKKKDASDKHKHLEVIAETNKLTNKPKVANKVVESATAVKKPVVKDTISVTVVTKGKTAQERLIEQRATDIQIVGVNTKYTYNPKLYTLLPKNISHIRLMSRINRHGVGPLRLYRNSTNKTLADGYFKYHQKHSELFSAYLARKMTLNNGVIGENVTLHKAFVDEMGYKFAETPVLSVNSAQEAEEKYLYVQLRLTPADRVQFWKYINTMREGNVVKLPKGLTIADVLTADL